MIRFKLSLLGSGCLTTMDVGGETHPRSRGFFKEHFPKTPSDAAAHIFMVLMLVAIIIFEMFVVLPTFHEPLSTWWIIHVSCGLFLAINVFCNLYKMILVDTTGRSLSLPSALKPGWMYCPFCQINSPPRAYHCHTCDVCVLRRDHHCTFAGKCVGHSNYRYYMHLLVYLWIGALYANFFHRTFVWGIVGELSAFTFCLLLVPVLALVFGFVTLYEFYIVFMTGVSLFGFFMFSGLLFYQLKLVSKGQTTYERKRGKQLYDMGVVENWKQIFGRNWILAWISPFISSPLHSDGTSFPTKENNESSKDM